MHYVMHPHDNNHIPSPQKADASGPTHFVTGCHNPITSQCLHIDRHVWYTLTAIPNNQRPHFMCCFCYLFHWCDCTKHVADVHHCNQFCFGIEHLVIFLHVNLLCVFCEWNILDYCTSGFGNHLPWYNGAVMLCHTHDDLWEWISGCV